MKKIFVIALTVVASGAAFGQNNTQEATEMTTKIVHDLSLTGEQAQKVADIYQNIAIKNNDALTNPANSEQYKKDALAYNTEACKTLINEVLTPEQRTLWAQIQSSAPAPRQVQPTKNRIAIPNKQQTAAPAPVKKEN